MPDSITPERLYFRFIRLHQRVFAEMAQTLKPTGLSVPQFDVLSTLTEREGLSQSDLATRLYVTKGNVSGLVDRLVEAGFVERRATPGDRRSHSLHLTEPGRKAAELGIRLQREFVEDTLGGMPMADMVGLDGFMTAWRDRVRSRAARRDGAA
jgi:MarR family transcriptional regulator, organic hydroperoxide resistance regulator